MLRALGLGAALTFGLGLTTALAFLLIGGPLALRGPYVISRAWPVIYPLSALFAALLLVAVARLSALGMPSIATAVVAAWFGQYVVLASGVLDSELTPEVAVGYWLLATGGPVQPLAALIGALMGRRLRRKSAAALTERNPDET